LFRLRQSRDDLFEELIGQNFESLHNLHNPPMSLKLKAPGLRYITRGQDEFCPVAPSDFEATMSFAQGGLANAWGAGVFRFNADDLAAFPFSTAELSPWYDELEDIMGVAGANDDLAPWFGRNERLLPPVRLSAYFQELMAAYERKRTAMNAKGIYFGRSRVAVATTAYRGRPAYGYENLDFFRPWNRSVYNPAYTLNELIESKAIRYERGLLATSWKECENCVEVTARRIDSGTTEIFRARHLLVAAGTLNSARLALASAGDTAARLPIMDNAMSCIPLVRLQRIGAARDPYDTPAGQLNMIYIGPATSEPVQAGVFGTAGPLRSDVLLNFPLSLTANLDCARYLTPAIGFLMLFYPDAPKPGNYLRLTDSGQLEIVHDIPPRGPVEREVIGGLRKLGYLSSFKLCVFPRIGAGLHYAGCLPMKADPGPYQTGADGRLYGSRRVYIVDGAVFPKLPSKNLTMTIMANAMRVAAALRQNR
jgi:choline dehydrogenase-like flavoprotein